MSFPHKLRYDKMKKTTATVLLFCITAIIKAQVVYEPLTNNVYPFLSHMEVKQMLDINSEVKPYSRKYISQLLNQLKEKAGQLNPIEKEELDRFAKEFSEIKTGSHIKNLVQYNYSDTAFSFSINPALGYGISSSGKYSGHNQWWGARVYGTYTDWFGADLDFRDIGEYGENVLKNKFFTPQRGYYINALTSNGIEYSDIRGSINLNWSWGSVSLAKDYQKWGHGIYGQLILSDKASSFPYIKLVLKPSDWLRFYYFHGWLTSNVDDSVYFYKTGAEQRGMPVYRKKFIDKYIAANLLTFSPIRELDISLGNSVIYSYPSVKPEYLIPFMIYKFLDHNAGRNNDYGNNGQLFADILIKYPRLCNFYGTVFLDMTSIRDIEAGNSWNTWYGITAGFSRADLLLENLDLNLEYTRITPRVYEHYIPTTTYKHLDYELGHWLGQNADQIRVQLNYIPAKNIYVSVYGERLRKGSLWNSEESYIKQLNQPFLSAPVRTDVNLGADIKYELFTSFYVKGNYKFSNVKDDQQGRTPDFLLGKKHQFAINVIYGIE